MDKFSDKNQWMKPISGFTSTRQNLPHLQSQGSYYFTTSNTWQRQELSADERDIILAALTFHNGSKYALDAAVVMPDHFHAILHPLPKRGGDYSLAEIFHSIKSYSAKMIVKSRNDGSKQIWQDENYDHLIRDENDYQTKLSYLIYNPVEAGLVACCEDYLWLFCPVIGKT